MTSNHREPRLPKRAEELLEGWPAPPRSALEWEESASNIMARIRDTSPGSTPDELLADPLPEEPEEKGREAPRAMESVPPAGELSLAEIARAALAGPEAARREVARDGLIAAELGRKNPQREAPPAPPAVRDAAGLQGRIVRVPEPAPKPQDERREKPELVAVPAEPAPAPVSEAAARSEFPAPPSREREPRRLGLAAFGGAVLAVAAIAALYVSFTQQEAPEARLTASAETPAPEQAVAPSQVNAAPSAAATAVASAAPSPPAKQLALDDLALASKSRVSSGNAPKEKSLSFHVKKESASSVGKLVLEEQKDNASEKTSAPIEQMQAQLPSPPPEAIAERPSTGAVSAALGPVLMSARSCVAGQDSGPRATVTFDGKTGRVKSVTLDASMAGSPAEGCIRSALMAARLPPFAEPTFSASVTVRPL
ncbi:MAG TPA: hypothetical protein VH062_23565 [Polyangiaceae bacterium]|jgi:hypothetical protein|nr:hypothetical protein [Polyangiaceae bacterium]